MREADAFLSGPRSFLANLLQGRERHYGAALKLTNISGPYLFLFSFRNCLRPISLLSVDPATVKPPLADTSCQRTLPMTANHDPPEAKQDNSRNLRVK